MTTLLLSEGTIFAGRYRVVRHIAAGGMGDVYEVIHLETDRSLALKVMRPHALISADTRERFRREARVTARIRSEHLVEILDAGVDESTDMPFLVMELLEGEDVGARLERAGRSSPSEVVTLLHQTALAIDKMHRAGVVHRDLKPENIFMTERDDGSPRVKVLDFGIAKILAGQEDQSATNELIGTPLYMAPEQFRAGIEVTTATDIYSLGMVAYTMIVGVPYWTREVDAGASLPVLASIIMGGFVEPASVRASRLGVALPQAFNAWLSKATAPAPVHRFATAQAAVAELADALGVPRPARQEPPPSSAPRAVRPAPLSSPRAVPSAPSSPAPERISLSSPNRHGAELSRMSRTASSPIHHSFAATIATKITSSAEVIRGRRLLELSVGLGVPLAILIGALVVSSRSSSSTAFANEASQVERRPAGPAAETEPSPEGSRAPAPPETKAPELPGGDAKSAESQEPPASSLKGSSKDAAPSAGSPSKGENGAAAHPKKLSEGGSPATQKQPNKRAPPHRLDTPE
jgi:serine/threonine-protein kinase